MNIKEETKCRVCGGRLNVCLDLGEIYPSSFLKADEKVSEDMKAPLVLTECEDCKLVQLKHTIDLDLMYRQYWYASSLNKSMVSSLADVVQDALSRVVLNRDDVVLDIGCNDATMLGMYPKSVRAVGFDPALNIERFSGPDIVLDYFNAEAYNQIPEIKKAKIVTAIAMFYDLPDPHKFVEDVATVLHEDGIFLVQFTDLLSMIKTTAFDNICHEHLEYYKYADVKFLLEAHGLQVIDVSYNDVNGGSLRVTAAHEGRYIPSSKVVEAYVDEQNFLATNTLQRFAERIEIVKQKVASFLEWGRGHEHAIFLMGASTKGNTLLQVCNVTSEDIPYAAEVNTEKFGLRTVGSNIEIISEIDALIKHPKCFFVPVWHFKDSLLRNEKIQDFMKAGGTLVFPLPYFHVVYLDYNYQIRETRI